MKLRGNREGPQPHRSRSGASDDAFPEGELLVDDLALRCTAPRLAVMIARPRRRPALLLPRWPLVFVSRRSRAELPAQHCIAGWTISGEHGWVISRNAEGALLDAGLHESDERS